MTTQEAEQHPAVVNATNYYAGLLSKPLVILGGPTSDKVEEIQGRKGTFRYAKQTSDPGSYYVETTDGKNTCTRRTNWKASNDAAGDRRATWKCRKGPSKTIAQEIYAISPEGAIGLVNAGSQNTILVTIGTPEWASPGSVNVEFLSATGIPVGEAEFSVRQSDTILPYAVTLKNSNGQSDASFSLNSKPLGKWKVVPFKKLKKSWK